MEQEASRRFSPNQSLVVTPLASARRRATALTFANEMNTIEGYLDHCFKNFMSSLVREKKLKNLRKEVDGMAGVYEAEGEHIVIRLVNERGCINYDIFSKHQNSCYWDGEIWAEFLEPREEKERKRSVRRLSLKEQTQLLMEKWEEIELRMNRENVSETDKILNRLGTERSKVLFN